MSIGFVSSANYWVKDPNNCPTEYQAQTCSGDDHVCGYDSGITYCYDPASLSAPGSVITSNTDRTCEDTCDGGYVVDCYDYDGGEPHCDNSGAFWCDRNSTCYTTQHRITNCSASAFGSSVCGVCNSGYRECDGGNDECEVVDNSACESNSHFDTADPCFGSYGHCDCNSGYDDCNNDDGDANQETGQYTSDGCEIDEWTTNCEAGANNRYNNNCVCVCDANYEDCDAGGVNATNGCEYQYNVACGTNAQNLSGCAGCTCNAGYYFCDGAPDDGDGCEVDDDGSCTIGSLVGTWSCSAGAGGCYQVDGGTEYDCTCIVDKSYFETGTNVEYQTNSSQAFLWGTDYTLGNLINITWSVGGGFFVNGTGAYFNGTLLGAGSNCEGDQSCENILYESDLPLENKTLVHCDNVTGATSDLCTIVDTAGGNTTEEMQDAVGGGFGAGLTYDDGGDSFTHNDSSSQADSDNSGNTVIQDLFFDTYGHVISLATTTLSIFSGSWNDLTDVPAGFDDDVDNDTQYTNGSGISLVGTQFNHSDTSSQSSEDNSGNTFIQDITLDTFGHITSLVSVAVDTATFLLTSTNFGGEVSGTYDNIVLDHDALDDQYVELGDSFGGDVSGTYDNLAVSDDSHLHDADNITNEHWVNESGDTMTGNLNMSANVTLNDQYLCNNATCNYYVKFNASGIILRGG